MNQTPANIRAAALAASAAGLCVVPPRQDGTKAPIGSWKQFQSRLPTDDELGAWYANGRTGVGLVTGRVAGNLELLEFDDYPTYEAFLARAAAWGLDELLRRLSDGYLSRSPAGGMHFLYRCSTIEGNQKLAQRNREPGEDDDEGIVTLIETRGEGGFVIEAPSYGSVHPSGRPYELLSGDFATIPTIDPDEREQLFALARSFHQLTDVSVKTHGTTMPPTIIGGRPGDDYNRRATWDQILTPHGWAFAFESEGEKHWRRPGKDRGASATTGRNDADRLYVFTTSTVFADLKSYSKFEAFALLNHGGDYAAAAKALAAEGYGDKPRKPTPAAVAVEASDVAVDLSDGDAPEAVDDPHGLARGFIDERRIDGESTFRFYQGSMYRHQGGGYVAVAEEELHAWITAHAKGVFDRHFNSPECETDHPKKVTGNIVTNAIGALKSETLLPSDAKLPAWIGEQPDGWNTADLLSMENGVVNLRLYADGWPEYFIPPTPRLFVTNGTGYPWRERSTTAAAAVWEGFLHSLWGDDPECIATLQEWFGYMLTADTSQQKILFLKGPRRSGKGTINRILRKLIGERNCAGITLDKFGYTFGLEGLIGKSLASISDCRVGPKSNHSLIVERLLSISGEDPLPAERKHRSEINCIFPTRLVMLSNELPKLPDPSGALEGRYVILPFTRSFYGAEDTALEPKLTAELPGILHWAIEGRKRLRERGRFVMPASAAAELHELEKLASPIRTFVRECCDMHHDKSIRKAAMYANYCDWCGREGLKPENEAVFGKDFMVAFPEVRSERPRAEDGSRPRVWEGIDIKLG